LAKGQRIRKVHIYSEGEELGALDFHALSHRFNFLLSLPQSETEGVLAEALDELGVEVEWRTPLLKLEAGADGAVAMIDEPGCGERSTVWDVVLGADGADSTVRRQAGFRFDGYTHHRIWSIADIEVDAWPHDPSTAQAFL